MQSSTHPSKLVPVALLAGLLLAAIKPALAAGFDPAQLLRGVGARPVNAGQGLTDSLQSRHCNTLKQWLAVAQDPTAIKEADSRGAPSGSVVPPGQAQLLLLISDAVFPRYFGKPYDQMPATELRNFAAQVLPACRRMGTFTPAEQQWVEQIWSLHMHPLLSQRLVRERMLGAPPPNSLAAPAAPLPPTPVPSIRAQRQMASFDAQEVSPGPYSGPLRYEMPAASLARLLGPGDIPADSPQTPDSGITQEAFFTRPNNAVKASERRDLLIQIAGHQFLKCQYDPQPIHQLPPQLARLSPPQRKTTMNAKTFQFWFHTAPVLSDEALTAFKRQMGGSGYFVVDRAANECPGNYRQALELVYGSGDALAQRTAGAASEVSKSASNWYERFEERSKAPDTTSTLSADGLPKVAFDKRATPLSEAELGQELNTDLIARGENLKARDDMLRAVAAIESQYDSMNAKRMIALVDERIMPAVNPLLAAAWANYPGRKQTQQRSFAEWEDQFLRPVLQACGKVMAMSETYRQAGAAAVGGQLGQALLGREVPSRRDWLIMAGDNEKQCKAAIELAFRLYQTRFQAAAPLDKAYMNKVYAQAKLAPPTQWQRAVVPSEQTPQPVRTYYFYGSARDISAAMARHQIAESAGNAARGAADALAAREQDLQQKLRLSQGFWLCYRDRCADGGERYVQFQWMLDQDDRARFMPVMQQANALMAPMKNFLSNRYTPGLDDVNWLIEQLCQPYREGMKREFHTLKNGPVPTEPLAWWQWLTSTDGYAAWRECRNNVSYAVRP